MALVARRGERFYWWALAVFCGGIVFNALYGVLQLGVAQTTGGNLDATVLSPLTGGASQINIYGAVEGANVYRPNALTGDPNHLGDRAPRSRCSCCSRSTSASSAAIACACR